ncbi:MAG: LytTR family DNA-binding domain-containing protein [Saprospiraceae bacterium]|nr:LytTR family DNA-binding domain-containing protein [Saprospiraceae bacterium]
MDVIIVEDEDLSREALRQMLLLLDPSLNIVGEAGTVEEGTQLLKNTQVDLVFLDINLPDGNGFNILQNLESIDFQLVFVTAYDEYALKAFQFAALHYILKPISPENIQEIIDRAKSNQKKSTSLESLEILESSLSENNQRLALTLKEDTICVAISDLIRLEADSNYTFAYIKGANKTLVSKTLSFYEQLLAEHNFVRIHNKHLVNLNYFKRYVRGRGGVLELGDGTKLAVSTRRKKDLLKSLKELGNSLTSWGLL